MFLCNKCGLCCRHIGGIELFKDIDDGTGTCRFLNKNTNLCTIYAVRPLFCNVDATYDSLFKKTMTREEFHELNQAACNVLKEETEDHGKKNIFC